MKKLYVPLLLSLVLLASTIIVHAASTTTFVVLPAMVSNIDGVPLDAPPGFAHGSIKANGGAAKSEFYATPAGLFAKEITLGDIASVSYYTKKGSDHVSAPGDWYILFYTKPYVGDKSTPGWYGDRIATEPYYAQNLVETVGDWNQWSSDDTVNRLRFYESTQGAPGENYGSYTDPDWTTFVAGDALSGLPYASREVLYISLQTASNWAAGFHGQVDGLRIELTDGTVARINFEPFMSVYDPNDCKKNGWANVVRGDGSPFSNQGACVSYVQTGR